MPRQIVENPGLGFLGQVPEAILGHILECAGGNGRRALRACSRSLHEAALKERLEQPIISYSVLRPGQVPTLQEQLATASVQEQARGLNIICTMQPVVALDLTVADFHQLLSLSLGQVAMRDPSFPHSLGQLTQLTGLSMVHVCSTDVPDADFMGQLGQQLPRLTSLSSFSIAHQHLQDTDLQGLSALTQLTSLGLQSSSGLIRGDFLVQDQAEGPSAKLLDSFSSRLKRLQLSHSGLDCRMTSPLGRLVHSCTALLELHLERGCVHPLVIAARGIEVLTLKHMTLCGMRWTELQKQLSKQLRQLEQLQHLDLCGTLVCPINTAFIEPLTKLSRLTFLDLAGSFASEEAMQVLWPPSAPLVHFCVPSCSAQFTLQFAEVDALPSLSSLGGSQLLWQLRPAAHWAHLTRLTELRIKELDLEAAEVLQHMPWLQRLVVDAGVKHGAIASIPVQLQELYLVKQWRGLSGPVRPTLWEGVRAQLLQRGRNG